MDDDTRIKGKGNGSFQSMGIEKDLLKGLNRMGYKAPTPVQRKSLPIVLAGMDLVCMARTGSGKTCVFLLPLVNKVKCHDENSGARALVLSPTRELAMQTFKFAKDMAKFTDLRIVPIVGGDPIEAQFEYLASRPDVIVATPGRLMHHLREISTFKLKHVKYLVFDEADRLFEMGFAEQLNEIVRECPAERQTLLFSATMPKQLVQFSRAGLRDPQLVRLDTDIKMSEELRIAFFAVRSNEKVAALLYLVRSIIPADQLTIVFTATKHHSEFLHTLLEKINVSSTLIYGAMDQESRAANLRTFRNGEVRYLIVTDVAARGIDVPLLNNVINFHFPTTPKLFVHRCGRAARQGRTGFALSLVEPEEMAYMADVHIFLGRPVTNQYIPSREGVEYNVAGPSFGGRSSAWAGGADEPTEEAGAYNLQTMSPKLVHTGMLPQDVLDEENEFFKRVLADDDGCAGMWVVCENGMKQFRRTRSEASKDGVKAAKKLIKGQSIKHIHPLVQGCDPARCSQAVVEKANFIRMLQTFRPAQTVFETGIGTGTQSNVAKSIGKAAGKETSGVLMMKALRLATAGGLERNKESKQHDRTEEANDEDEDANADGDDDDEDSDGVEGGDRGRDNGDDDGDEDIAADEWDDEDGGVNEGAAGDEASVSMSCSGAENKVRLSIAERKKLKRKGLNNSEIAVEGRRRALSAAASNQYSQPSQEGAGGAGFKDSRFYMAYGTEDEHLNFVEDSMQPRSGLRDTEMQSAAMLESAILDLQPDSAIDMNRKKKMMRWDAKKRKFVKQTLDEMASAKGAKRVRSESGVNGRTSDKPLGELYEKWKKKSRREVSAAGTGEETDSRPRPDFRHNSKVKDELRSASDIRKMKKMKDNNKLKNMSKDKRKAIEGKKRKSQSTFSSVKSKDRNSQRKR